MSSRKDGSEMSSIEDADYIEHKAPSVEALVKQIREDAKFKKLLKKSVLSLLGPVYKKLSARVSEKIERKMKGVGEHDCKDVVESAIAQFIIGFDQFYISDQEKLLNRIKKLEESVVRVKGKSTVRNVSVKDVCRPQKRDVSTKSAKPAPKPPKADVSNSFSVSGIRASSLLLSKSSNLEENSKSIFEKDRDK